MQSIEGLRVFGAFFLFNIQQNKNENQSNITDAFAFRVVV